jgi:hypothetical protein
MPNAPSCANTAADRYGVRFSSRRKKAFEIFYRVAYTYLWCHKKVEPATVTESAMKGMRKHFALPGYAGADRKAFGPLFAFSLRCSLFSAIRYAPPNSGGAPRHCCVSANAAVFSPRRLLFQAGRLYA